IGAELRDQIKRKGKRSKRAYHHIKTELFRHLKRLKLEGIKIIVLEDLRYIKHGKRGTFSRHVNRLLSLLVINQGSRLAQLPVRGIGRPYHLRLALQDLAAVSQLRQD